MSLGRDWEVWFLREGSVIGEVGDVEILSIVIAERLGWVEGSVNDITEW